MIPFKKTFLTSKELICIEDAVKKAVDSILELKETYTFINEIF